MILSLGRDYSGEPGYIVQIKSQRLSDGLVKVRPRHLLVIPKEECFSIDVIYRRGEVDGVNKIVDVDAITNALAVTDQIRFSRQERVGEAAYPKGSGTKHNAGAQDHQLHVTLIM